MSDTRPSILITEDWINIYDEAGVAVGTALSLENTGPNLCELHISELEPSDRGINAGANTVYPLQTKYLNTGNTGLWARVKANAKNTTMQVGLLNGLITTSPLPTINPSLFIKFHPFLIPISGIITVLVRNRSDSQMELQQLLSLEAFSDGVNEGVSIISMNIYFNPDLAGATIGAQTGAAYENDRDGTFLSILGGAIEMFSLTDFDLGINTDSLHIAGGAINYAELPQGAIDIQTINEHKTFTRDLVISSGDDFVIVFTNSIVSEGTASITDALLSGEFTSFPVGVLPPDPII